MEEITCTKCGSINDYRIEKKSNNHVAYCLACQAYIKNVPYEEPALHFGKYKGTKIKDFTTPDMVSYLNWAYQNTRLTKRLKLAIENHLGL